MKIYGTIASERATKGQGGNEYLDIKVKNEQGELIERYIFETQRDGKISVRRWESILIACDGKHESIKQILDCDDCSEALDNL